MKKTATSFEPDLAHLPLEWAALVSTAWSDAQEDPIPPRAVRFYQREMRRLKAIRKSEQGSEYNKLRRAVGRMVLKGTLGHPGLATFRLLFGSREAAGLEPFLLLVRAMGLDDIDDNSLKSMRQVWQAFVPWLTTAKLKPAKEQKLKAAHQALRELLWAVHDKNNPGLRREIRAEIQLGTDEVEALDAFRSERAHLQSSKDVLHDLLSGPNKDLLRGEIQQYWTELRATNDPSIAYHYSSAIAATEALLGAYAPKKVDTERVAREAAAKVLTDAAEDQKGWRREQRLARAREFEKIGEEGKDGHHGDV